MNIFEIEASLQEVFDTIEENGGEITPELEEFLLIKQEEFKNKVSDYSKVIQQLKNDVNAVKLEQTRLSCLKKLKEKTIERLTNIISEAIIKFGDTTKSGGKFVDLGTSKISVRQTEACEVSEVAIDVLNRSILSAINNGAIANLGTLAGIDISETAHNFVNKEGDIYDFNETEIKIPTEGDIDAATFKITFDIPLNCIFDGSSDAVLDLAKDHICTSTISMDKKQLKENIKSDNNSNLAIIKNNKSITIK